MTFKTSSQEQYLRSLAKLLNLLDETFTIDLSELCKLWEFCRQVAESLGKIDPGNETAIAALVDLIHPTQNKYIRYDYARMEASESLGKIDPGNETATAALVDLIQTAKYFEDWDFLSEAVRILG